MNSEFGIGQNGGNWPIGFCSQVGALRKAHFRRPPCEKGKKEKRGGGKKERPPERAAFLYQIFGEPSATPKAQTFPARGEEDTEHGN